VVYNLNVLANPTPSPSTVSVAPTTSTIDANCSLPRVRKNWATLTSSEQSNYLIACQLLKNKQEIPISGQPSMSLWDFFTEIHNSDLNNWYAHGGSGFFPWHRRFLWQFETALREVVKEQRPDIDYCSITVPYWGWEVDAPAPSEAPIWTSASFGIFKDTDSNGCVLSGIAKDWVTSDGNCLQRSWDTSVSFVGSSGLMSLITDYSTYENLEPNYEDGAHASPHNYINGYMAIFRSPDDPIFLSSSLHCRSFLGYLGGLLRLR